MKKPDRFARLVGQHRHIACDGMGYVLLEETARHLLRLEHRAVVRLVTRQQVNLGRFIDKDLLLYALVRYRKGKP